MPGQGDQSEDLAAILSSMAEAIQLLTERTQIRDDTGASSTLQNAATLQGTFIYKPEQDLIFTTWFSRNKAIIEESTQADKLRVQLLLKALGAGVL